MSYYQEPQKCLSFGSAPVVGGGCNCGSGSGTAQPKEPVYTLAMLKGLLLANGKPVLDLGCELMNTDEFINALQDFLADKLNDPAVLAAIVSAVIASPDFATAVNKVADLATIAAKACATLAVVSEPAEILAYGKDCGSFGKAKIVMTPLRELTFKAAVDGPGAPIITTDLGPLPVGRWMISLYFWGTMTPVVGTTYPQTGTSVHTIVQGGQSATAAVSATFVRDESYGHGANHTFVVNSNGSNLKIETQLGAITGMVKGDYTIFAQELPTHNVTIGG